MSALRKAVAKACGDPDEIVGDPRSCRFDPATLQCKEGNGTDCLASAEIEVVRKWYGGPKSKSGRSSLAEGVPFGSEPFWITPGMPPEYGLAMSFPKLAARELLRYLLMDPAPGEGFEITHFDLDRDMGKIEAMHRLLTPESADLRAFKSRGGKLLIYQGWADPITPPLRPIAYYEALERTMGGRTAAQEVARLFLIPGFGHCGGRGVEESPGVDTRGIDPLAALERWAEEGEPPEKLTTRKLDRDDQVRWSRPVCPYPQSAVHTGNGDRTQAENWTCADGRHSTRFRHSPSPEVVNAE